MKKNSWLVVAIFSVAIMMPFKGFSQRADPNTMTQEEREKYFAKLRESSVADHKKMMDQLGIDSIREVLMEMTPMLRTLQTTTNQKRILFQNCLIR